MPEGVQLRDVRDCDLPHFFEHQRDPQALMMAAFRSRDRDAFLAHWAKLRGDPTNITRTIVSEGVVAGNVGSFEQSGQKLVCYWLGREHWGKGVATAALRQFLRIVAHRPLHAFVARHNIGSVRVLEKCGFVQCAMPPLPPHDHTVYDSQPKVEEYFMVLQGSAESAR